MNADLIPPAPEFIDVVFPPEVKPPDEVWRCELCDWVGHPSDFNDHDEVHLP